MQIHVLASGSSGNATFFKFDNANILVDAGISARRIQNALSEIGTAVEDLDAILITHEHSDHVSGLPTLMKKYRLPVYARPETWRKMPSRRQLLPECCRNLYQSLDFGDVKVEAFDILHDAADPVGYNFYEGDQKYSLATDLGFVTDTVKKALEQSNALVLETNHDLAMLRGGTYPWHLKRRILSNRGHLSNEEAGKTLASLDNQKDCQVFLAHISKENNRRELAESTVAGILQERGLAVGEDITLHVTFPDTVVSWREE
jgi:phosphoribosyl 1,2-cyclic phosphodiesterase